jgi:hypothetical protein
MRLRSAAIPSVKPVGVRVATVVFGVRIALIGEALHVAPGGLYARPSQRASRLSDRPALLASAAPRDNLNAPMDSHAFAEHAPAPAGSRRTGRCD